MSSKASQPPQQQPWRLAASKPGRSNERQSPPLDQQHQNGTSRIGFKPDAKDNKSGPDRSSGTAGRNGSPAALATTSSRSSTPSSKPSTRPLMNETASRMNASSFDAANNMMPSFARNQHRQPSPYQQSFPQQQRQQNPQTQFQYSGLNTAERNGSKIVTHTQNKDERNSSPETSQEQKTSEKLRTDGEEMGKSKRPSTTTTTTPSPSVTPSVTPSSTPAPETDEKEQSKDGDQSLVPASASPQPVIKHPLKNKWAMWYFKNDKSKDWKDNQKYVYSFDTIEDFWALYNHMLPPSELQSGCDYSLFKEGIEPMWEDPSNKNGGRWLINSLKQQRQYVLDRFWMETLLCLVGEIFEDASDEVCGTVINIRPKGDKLGIWTRDAEDQEKNMVIGRGLRDNLGLPKQTQLGFQAHKDTSTKYGSVTPNKYFA